MATLLTGHTIHKHLSVLTERWRQNITRLTPKFENFVDPELHTDYSDTTPEEHEVNDHIRRKRSVNEYTIELMIVVDKNVASFHGDKLKHYVNLLMNTVRINVLLCKKRTE